MPPKADKYTVTSKKKATSKYANPSPYTVIEDLEGNSKVQQEHPGILTAGNISKIPFRIANST